MNFLILPILIIISLFFEKIKNKYISYSVIAITSIYGFISIYLNESVGIPVLNYFEALLILENKLFFILYFFITLTVVLKNKISVDFNKKDIIWYLSLLSVPATYNLDIFSFMLSFFFVWCVYYYFYSDDNVRLIEKVSVFNIVLCSYILKNTIYVNYEKNIVIVLSISIVLFFICNMMNSFNNSAKLFSPTLAFVGVVLFDYVNENFLISDEIRLYLLLMLVVIKFIYKVNPTIFASIIISFSWVMNIIDSSFFIFTFLGLIFWADIVKYINADRALHINKILPRLINLSGILVVVILITSFEGHNAYAIACLSLLYFLMIAKSLLISLIYNSINRNRFMFGSISILVGITFYYIKELT